MIVIGLALFSFAMAAVISLNVFERLPHLEDELAYLYQAKVFARGDIVGPVLTPTSAYWQPFVIEHSSGARFSKYTPGWSMLLAVGINLGEPWVINAFFAALTVALVYRFAGEIFGRDAGLFAAALTAFSPMALLLSGTMMNHTAALFFTTLFFYAYWRITRRRRAMLWGALAGVALGLTIINRPLSAVAVTVPFILLSLIRLGGDLIKARARFLPTLAPLVTLSVIALTISAAIPVYNYAATGDPTKNLYTLVPGWQYDRVGFGEGYGRNGHTIHKGVLHARYDLSLTAADLFGWQLGVFTPETPEQYDSRVPDENRDCRNLAQSQATLQQHLRTCSAYWPVVGVSWILLLPGMLAAFRRDWAWFWVVIGVLWILLLPMAYDRALVPWIAAGVLWMLAPLVFIVRRADADPRALWGWLMFAVIVSVIGIHLAYWVGSQRYSTRYYFEALTAAAIISALPLAWLVTKARRSWMRMAIYAGVAAVCAWSLFMYSVPRISALYGYNRVTRAIIDAVHERRQTDQPVLVLVTGDTPRRWRSQGALNAVSSPYLDSEIITAWYDGESMRELLVRSFLEREIIELRADGENAYFEDMCTADGCPVINHAARPPMSIQP